MIAGNKFQTQKGHPIRDGLFALAIKLAAVLFKNFLSCSTRVYFTSVAFPTSIAFAVYRWQSPVVSLKRKYG